MSIPTKELFMTPETLMLVGTNPTWQEDIRALAPDLGYTVLTGPHSTDEVLAALDAGTFSMLLIEQGHDLSRSPELLAALERAAAPTVQVTTRAECLPAEHITLNRPITQVSLAVAVEKARHGHTLNMALRKARQEIELVNAAFHARFDSSPLGMYRSTLQGRELPAAQLGGAGQRRLYPGGTDPDTQRRAVDVP